MALITPPIKNIKITDAKLSAKEFVQFAEVRRKSTISQVTEPLKEVIQKGDVHLQLEHLTSYFSHQTSCRLYHHRDLIVNSESFIKGNLNI